jgi:hypothetical protein
MPLTTIIFEYFVAVIIVWRVTHLFSAEDGPLDIIFRFRKLLGDSVFGKLMDCFYCLSMWMGFLMALYFHQNWSTTILMSLYYSGASILLEKLTNKNMN